MLILYVILLINLAFFRTALSNVSLSDFSLFSVALFQYCAILILNCLMQHYFNVPSFDNTLVVVTLFLVTLIFVARFNPTL